MKVNLESIRQLSNKDLELCINRPSIYHILGQMVPIIDNPVEIKV